MTWTATLIEAVDKDTHWKVNIEYTDGVRVEEEASNFKGTTVQELKAQARRTAQQFEQTDNVDLLPLVGTSIDVTPPAVVPPPTPTPAEIAKAAWFEDYRSLQQMLQVTTDIPALLDATAQNSIDALRVTLEADWLNSYLGDI